MNSFDTLFLPLSDLYQLRNQGRILIGCIPWERDLQEKFVTYLFCYAEVITVRFRVKDGSAVCMDGARRLDAIFQFMDGRLGILGEGDVYYGGGQPATPDGPTQQSCSGITQNGPIRQGRVELTDSDRSQFDSILVAVRVHQDLTEDDVRIMTSHFSDMKQLALSDMDDSSPLKTPRIIFMERLMRYHRDLMEGLADSSTPEDRMANAASFASYLMLILSSPAFKSTKISLMDINLYINGTEEVDAELAGYVDSILRRCFWLGVKKGAIRILATCTLLHWYPGADGFDVRDLMAELASKGLVSRIIPEKVWQVGRCVKLVMLKKLSHK